MWLWPGCIWVRTCCRHAFVYLDFIVQRALSCADIRSSHPPTLLVGRKHSVRRKVHPPICILEAQACTMWWWRSATIVLLVREQRVRYRSVVTVAFLVLSQVYRLIQLSLAVWHSERERLMLSHHVVPWRLEVGRLGRRHIEALW